MYLLHICSSHANARYTSHALKKANKQESKILSEKLKGFRDGLSYSQKSSETREVPLPILICPFL